MAEHIQLAWKETGMQNDILNLPKEISRWRRIHGREADNKVNIRETDVNS
jgi:hypothetical protein